MSGADIPYQLRPNKHIDREIFFDCIRRSIGFATPEETVYMSMGGKHLVDHHAIYHSVGIKNSFSFDAEDNTVYRQIFNTPFGFTSCDEMKSDKFVAEFDNIADEYADAARFVVWLDFTSHKERPEQLGEFQALLSKLPVGSIARLTVNADPRCFTIPKNKWSKGITTVNEARREKFISQMGDFIGTVESKHMSNLELPVTIAKCVKFAVSKVQLAAKSWCVRPLNLQWYSDSTPMLSCTLIVLEKENADQVLESNAFSKWEFFSKDWNHVHRVYVPDLSIKERSFIENCIGKKTAKQIADALGFQFIDDEGENISQIENFIRHSRFYPSFKKMVV